MNVPMRSAVLVLLGLTGCGHGAEPGRVMARGDTGPVAERGDLVVQDQAVEGGDEVEPDDVADRGREAAPRVAAVPGEPRVSALWGVAGEAWAPTSRLPDFSYAGYHAGERPIPDVPVAANVRDFGARGMASPTTLRRSRRRSTPPRVARCSCRQGPT